MRLRIILLVAVVVLPMGLGAIWSLSNYAEELLDPCMHWGTGSSGSYSISAQVRPGDPCGGGFKGTTQTRGQAAVTALLVPGVILMAAALALFAASTSRPGLLVISACMMFLEAAPLIWSFAPVLILTGIALMLISRRIHLRTSPPFQGASEGSPGLKARLRHLFLDQNFFFSE
jgi:hypothetical protein